MDGLMLRTASPQSVEKARAFNLENARAFSFFFSCFFFSPHQSAFFFLPFFFFYFVSPNHAIIFFAASKHLARCHIPSSRLPLHAFVYVLYVLPCSLFRPVQRLTTSDTHSLLLLWVHAGCPNERHDRWMCQMVTCMHARHTWSYIIGGCFTFFLSPKHFTLQSDGALLFS